MWFASSIHASLICHFRVLSLASILWFWELLCFNQCNGNSELCGGKFARSQALVCSKLSKTLGSQTVA